MKKTYFLIFTIFLMIANASFAVPSCKKIEDECLEAGSTKIISGFKVQKNCWKYKSTYNCQESSTIDNCSKYRQQNCFEVSAKSSKTHHGKSIELAKKFKCTTKEKFKKTINVASNKKLDCNQEIPHLDGGYVDIDDYEKNKDMESSIAQLAILNEMQGQIKDELSKLFKGSENSCTRIVAGVKNCCKGGKGWAVSLGLNHCTATDKATVEKRENGLCHHIGQYCAEKALGVCIRKKQSYCCFNSKLSKALQEQGRAQLGKLWGSAKQPDCSGFSREDLAKIDFSKLDLSSVYEELGKNYKAPDLKRINSSMQQSLKMIQQDFKNQDFKNTVKAKNQ